MRSRTHIWNTTIFPKELQRTRILCDIFCKNVPPHSGIRQLSFEPEFNATTAQQHVSHPLDVLPCKHYDYVASLFLSTRGKPVHLAQEKTKDIRAPVVIQGAPTTDYNI